MVVLVLLVLLEFLLLWLLLAVVAVLWGRIRAAEARLRRLEGQGPEALAGRGVAAFTPPRPAQKPALPLAPAQPPPPPAPPALEPPARPMPLAGPGGAPGSRPPAGPPSAWQRLERRLIENWTGILGVVVLVAGLTFVMVNVALRLGPVARFLVLLAAGGALILPSLLWGALPRWRPLTHWLRSGGAALILFACMAGGALPELGLRWLVDPRQALALLLAGMAVNLLLAVLTRTQAVASLHVLVNLVPLLYVPAQGLPLAIASAVALMGQALPRLRSWDRHRLLVAAGYGLFQGSWLWRSTVLRDADTSLRWGGLGAALLVFGAGVLWLQRGRGLRRRLTTVRLTTLLLCWGGIALALMLYPSTAALRSSGLALVAVVALLLARRARAAGGRPLDLAHTLIAQALVMASLLCLQPLIVDGLLLSVVLLVEAVLFLGLGVLEREPILRSVGWVAVVLMALILLAQGPEAALANTAAHHQLRDGGLLIGSAVLLGLVATLLHLRAVPLPSPPVLGWLAGGLVFTGASLVPPVAWQPALALVSMGGLLLGERRVRPPGLGQGTAMAVGGAHLVSWLWMLQAERSRPELLGQLLPLAALALVTLATARRGLRRPLALDLLGLDIGLAAYLLLRPLSPLLPGVAWLLLSLAALEGANRLRRPEVSHGLALGLGYLAAFSANYLLVVSQSPATITLAWLPLRARLLIELFALAVLLYWWCLRPRPWLRRSRLWQAAHPCLLEWLLLGVATTVLAEVESLWRPLAWSLLALALLSPPVRRLLAARVQVYGVLVYWLAIAATLGILSTGETPSPHWFDQPATLASLAILLQVLFMVVAQRWLLPAALTNPGGWPLLASIGRRVAAHRHRWLGYPLFAAVALHLADRYDHALLTLLWALEAFVIYVLSAVLRDNQFRVVALVGLGGCLLRLLAIDMAQADLGLRGLVFIGVGALMLAMNAIYNRFRERFR